MNPPSSGFATYPNVGPRRNGLGSTFPWGRLGTWSEEVESLTRSHEFRADDVLYFPPVRADLEETRTLAMKVQAERGVPILAQCLVGDPRPKIDGVRVVVDLLEVALGRLDLSEVKPGEAAAWPLLPGGSEEALESAAVGLKERGFESLQPVALDLDPRDLRVLAGEIEEDSGLSLFHAQSPTQQQSSIALLRVGLLPFLQRPLPGSPLVGIGNLEASGRLALCGEVLHLLDENPAQAAELLRAARFAEELPQDLRSIARDGHLSVLPWATGRSRLVIEEWALGEEFETLTELYVQLAG